MTKSVSYRKIMIKNTILEICKDWHFLGLNLSNKLVSFTIERCDELWLHDEYDGRSKWLGEVSAAQHRKCASQASIGRADSVCDNELKQVNISVCSSGRIVKDTWQNPHLYANLESKMKKPAGCQKTLWSVGPTVNERIPFIFIS